MKRLIRVFGLLVVTVMCLGPVAAAQADPFALEIDNAVMDLGELSGVRAIDSTNTPPDPSATLTGEVTGTGVTVPKAGFVFPPKNAEVSPGINAVINLEANEDITGTYDSGNGELELAANLKATVDVFGSSCVISPIDLVLSTRNGKPYLGVPFASGLAGEGALSARWAGLPPISGPSTCNMVGQLIAGPGGIWMSHGIADAQTCEDQPAHPGCDPAVQPPEQAPKITAQPGASTQATEATFSFAKADAEPSPVTGFQCSLDSGAFEACDSGTKTYTGLAIGSHKFEVRATNDVGEGPTATYPWTITEKVEPPTCETDPSLCPKPDKAKFGSLKIKPKNTAVKRGKKLVIKVRVKNTGKARATGVRICVKAPKRFVKAKKCVNKRSLAAGKTATAKFKVTVKKKAKRGKKVVLKFTATAKGVAAKRGKAKIRVR